MHRLPSPRSTAAACGALLALWPALAASQPSPTAALSPRNANYSIDVELDAAQRTLTGRQVLTWRNISPVAAGELQFHLYKAVLTLVNTIY